MTERERIRDADRHGNAEVYDTTARPATTRHPEGTVSAPTYGAGVTSMSPVDQVRWGPIVAGLFTALTTLLVLSVLGLAIGLTAYDANDPLGSFGVGAGIWGLISVLLAFGVGGYMAGGTAAVRGSNNGILNGALVWIVTLPLLLYLLSSGIGFLLGTAGSVLGTAAEVAAPLAGQAAGEAADDPALQATAQAGGQDLGQAAQATAQALQQQVTPEQVEQATTTAGRTAWSTLLWLGLGALAAIGGGYLGGRTTSSRRTTVATA